MIEVLIVPGTMFRTLIKPDGGWELILGDFSVRTFLIDGCYRLRKGECDSGAGRLARRRNGGVNLTSLN